MSLERFDSDGGGRAIAAPPSFRYSTLYPAWTSASLAGHGSELRCKSSESVVGSSAGIMPCPSGQRMRAAIQIRFGTDCRPEAKAGGNLEQAPAPEAFFPVSEVHRLEARDKHADDPQ